MTLSDEERKFTKPTQSVLRLTAPILGSNRNITAYNWFSSVELVGELRRRKLAYTGTLKNKREVPKQFLPDKIKDFGSLMYSFTDDINVVPHTQKNLKLCC
ncbi:hypothetical protein PR048_030569 [Dryococelus australis]|uniref:PiggyBac transposable element-derived protein domain-containing protein n=1 Tax=Dryococelus australis TaxID=614101 RepID=A0ABQ9GC63_9NEOP|nr:hypothetical protein PR048_030569 [Dryococelus australis]